MSKPFDKRRSVRIGSFEYLVDDDDRTAWIRDGNSGGAKVFILPEIAEIEGFVYTITSVETGGFNTPWDDGIEELFIPDCYEYVDELSFYVSPIKKLHIGKGLAAFHPWWLYARRSNLTIDIHPDNPFLKMSEDGHLLLSKDGRQVIALIHDIEEIAVPEGVETLGHLAISCTANLKTIHFPSSLRVVSTESLMENQRIERLAFPEGVMRIGSQAFASNRALKEVDLPSTLWEMDDCVFFECNALQRAIIRTPYVLPRTDFFAFEVTPLETIHLVVPEHLVQEYRKHPLWRLFEHIEAIK